MAPFHWPHMSVSMATGGQWLSCAVLCWTFKELPSHTRPGTPVPSCHTRCLHLLHLWEVPGRCSPGKERTDILICVFSFAFHQCIWQKQHGGQSWFLQCTAWPGEMKRRAISCNRKSVVTTCGIV